LPSLLITRHILDSYKKYIITLHTITQTMQTTTTLYSKLIIRSIIKPNTLHWPIQSSPYGHIIMHHQTRALHHHDYDGGDAEEHNRIKIARIAVKLFAQFRSELQSDECASSWWEWIYPLRCLSGKVFSVLLY
jgi:hypothetical protein